MYKMIVKARVAHLFAQANRGNWQIIVDELAPKFSYRFIGDTPLGGTRTTKPAMQAWFQRLYRLIPNFQFVPKTIVVSGPPWRTTVMCYVKIHGTQPDGKGGTMPYENEFMQLAELKWGKVTSILTLEDTQRFVNLLSKLEKAGFPEATAEMIEG